MRKQSCILSWAVLRGMLWSGRFGAAGARTRPERALNEVGPFRKLSCMPRRCMFALSVLRAVSRFL